MKDLMTQYYKRLGNASYTFILAALMMFLTAYATASTAFAAPKEEPQLMFVQVADDFKVDQTAKTFRLVKVNRLRNGRIKRARTFQGGPAECHAFRL